ncbi:HAD-IA family hydrolase [Piscinibacter defluvii]|uniref:HAD-IA family hydrolase n=1 Tax=Piscinibacter defluvii TaxID=1796922 RepID=UPI000FDF2847|nr:HAD-IA family hydrolase [Piscinibacter defluvii]
MTTPATPPLALLFDLGGVLLNVDFERALEAWAPFSALGIDDLRRRFTFDAAYAHHERGEIGAQAYFAHLIELLKLRAAVDQVEAGWNAVFVGEIVETRRLVETARQRMTCCAFTNTNASHMRTWSALYPRVVSTFDRIFASHQMGLRKPERAAFEYICRSLALPPSTILFFDDLAENVQAAQQAGFQAVWVRTPRDVAEALRAAGVA